MGTMNTCIDDRLPAGVVALGVTLILVMAAALICNIARDIAEMRVRWNAVAAGQERRRMERHQLLQRLLIYPMLSKNLEKGLMIGAVKG